MDNPKKQHASSLESAERETTSAGLSSVPAIETLTSPLQESGRTLLDEALNDFHEVRTEAAEEGLPKPSDMALENAKRLLHEMYQLHHGRFEVYPTPDGEVAIDTPSEYGRSLILLCASDGSVLCLVNVDGVHRRAWYRNADSLPDGFVREALRELAQQPI